MEEVRFKNLMRFRPSLPSDIDRKWMDIDRWMGNYFFLSLSVNSLIYFLTYMHIIYFHGFFQCSVSRILGRNICFCTRIV